MDADAHRYEGRVGCLSALIRAIRGEIDRIRTGRGWRGLTRMLGADWGLLMFFAVGMIYVTSARVSGKSLYDSVVTIVLRRVMASAHSVKRV